MKLRLKTLEDGLKHVSSFSNNLNAFCGSPKTEKSSNILGFLTSTGGLRKRSTSQPRGSTFGRNTPLQQANAGNETAVGELEGANNLRKKNTAGENVLKKGLWASRNKIVDIGEKENMEMKANTITNNSDSIASGELKSKGSDKEAATNSDSEDMVSGFLYDRLQKEVISLRKFCEAKENDLNSKDQEIKVKFKTLSLSLSLSYSG